MYNLKLARGPVPFPKPAGIASLDDAGWSGKPNSMAGVITAVDGPRPAATTRNQRRTRTGQASPASRPVLSLRLRCCGSVIDSVGHEATVLSNSAKKQDSNIPGFPGWRHPTAPYLGTVLYQIQPRARKGKLEGRGVCGRLVCAANVRRGPASWHLVCRKRDAGRCSAGSLEDFLLGKVAAVIISAACLLVLRQRCKHSPLLHQNQW